MPLSHFPCEEVKGEVESMVQGGELPLSEVARLSIAGLPEADPRAAGWLADYLYEEISLYPHVLSRCKLQVYRNGVLRVRAGGQVEPAASDPRGTLRRSPAYLRARIHWLMLTERMPLGTMESLATELEVPTIEVADAAQIALLLPPVQIFASGIFWGHLRGCTHEQLCQSALSGPWPNRIHRLNTYAPSEEQKHTEDPNQRRNHG